MSKKSDVIIASPNKLVNDFRSGVMKGAGYDTSQLNKRPLIAIANSHTEMTAGHNHLNKLADKVKEGILVEGGEYAEFNVPAPCDGISMAHDGMRYVLAQRDLIAKVHVESSVRAHHPDQVLLILMNPGIVAQCSVTRFGGGDQVHRLIKNFHTHTGVRNIQRQQTASSGLQLVPRFTLNLLP